MITDWRDRAEDLVSLSELTDSANQEYYKPLAGYAPIDIVLQEQSSNLYISERLPLNPFSEGLPRLIKELKLCYGDDVHKIVKRLSLNIGYETSRIRIVLRKMGIIKSFKEVKEIRDKVQRDYWLARRDKQRVRTGRTKFHN